MEKIKLSEYLEKISRINIKLENQPFSEEIERLVDAVDSNKYKIAVVGEFSAGKSTFINALLGEELLYYSNNEATGTITTIQYGESAYAQVRRKDGSLVDEFTIDDKDNREKLNDYLNIRNNKEDIRNVDIFYPIEGIDNDVIFFDTPGIEKMSEVQLRLTKSVLDQANAILFLIKKEGLTGPALKVLLGKNEIIGKIPTDNIFIVMTHIGDIYNTRLQNVAKKEVLRLAGDVEKRLGEAGVQGLKVYPVDSKEYLWGCNNQLYEKEKETRNVLLNGEVLEQAIYRERSGFEALKSELFEFLQADNRHVNLIKDILNKINLLLEVIEEKISVEDENYKKTDMLIAEIEEQIENACKNQRKFYSRVARNLRQNINSFLDSVKRDKDQKAKEDKNIRELINQIFKRLTDLNDERFQFCIGATISDVKQFASEIAKNTNEHIKILIKNYLKKCYDDEFAQMFRKEVNVTFEDSHKEFKIEFESINDEMSLKDEDLQRLEQDKKQAERTIEDLEAECSLLEKEIEQKVKKYQQERLKVQECERKLENIGNRPKAVQKYKDVTKSKGRLFWKKTWVEKEPDGLDKSKGEEWDRMLEMLQEESLEKSNYAEKISKEVDLLKRKKKKIDNTIEEIQGNIVRIDKKFHLRNEYIEIEKIRNTDIYISRKKNEVASCCQQIKMRMLKQLISQIEDYLYEMRENLEELIKNETNVRVDEYKNELLKKNARLCEKIRISKDTRQDLIKQVTELKEELANERAVSGI